MTVAAPAGIALAGVLAAVEYPLLAGFSVAGVRILVLLDMIASRALRDLEPIQLSDAQQ
ncbi:hypothetical protein [Kocuria nitroreducens]|uniref:hypothetical protein n=1 Tax=Kocuria nitroreducens TaxID=3058914 RepID=UPI0036DC2CD8